jgi:hypothetical protein
MGLLNHALVQRFMLTGHSISSFGDIAEERTVRALGLITLIQLPLRTVVLRGNSCWTPAP